MRQTTLTRGNLDVAVDVAEDVVEVDVESETQILDDKTVVVVLETIMPAVRAGLEVQTHLLRHLLAVTTPAFLPTTTNRLGLDQNRGIAATDVGRLWVVARLRHLCLAAVTVVVAATIQTPVAVISSGSAMETQIKPKTQTLRSWEAVQPPMVVVQSLIQVQEILEMGF